MSGTDPLTRRLIIIRGVVQGVGFRWFAKELAESMRLSGWTRNRDDGSVELEAEGSTAALDDFERRLRTGNPSAKVMEMSSVPVAPRGGNGFEIRRG